MEELSTGRYICSWYYTMNNTRLDTEHDEHGVHHSHGPQNEPNAVDHGRADDGRGTKPVRSTTA